MGEVDQTLKEEAWKEFHENEKVAVRNYREEQQKISEAFSEATAPFREIRHIALQEANNKFRDNIGKFQKVYDEKIAQIEKSYMNCYNCDEHFKYIDGMNKCPRCGKPFSKVLKEKDVK